MKTSIAILAIIFLGFVPQAGAARTENVQSENVQSKNAQSENAHAGFMLNGNVLADSAMPNGNVLADSADTLNPRGIYKLMTIWGKDSLVVHQPFDQYKLCTDRITLTFSFQSNWGSTSFTMKENDGSGTVFNHTGDAPSDPADTTASRIYDSGPAAFTLKWWSKHPAHTIFPENGWCYERYQSGEFTPRAKAVFDDLQSAPAAYDEKEPLVGTWRVVCTTRSLKGMKKTAAELAATIRAFHYAVITPTRFTHTKGHSVPITILDKKTFHINRATYATIDWLTANLVAVTIVSDDGRTKSYSSYEIWQRVTDDVPPMTRILTDFPRGTHRMK